jgi:ribonuclease Z
VVAGVLGGHEALAEAGRGCDLLLHEATFEDDLATETVDRGHATISEAVEVTRRMQAGATVLTHFAQRYPKFPSFDHSSHMHVGFAFDLMTVVAHDLPHLGLLHSSLAALFPPNEDDEDDSDEGDDN